MDKIRGCGWRRGAGNNYHSTTKEKNDTNICDSEEKMLIFSIVNLFWNFMIWRDVSIQRRIFQVFRLRGGAEFCMHFRIV